MKHAIGLALGLLVATGLTGCYAGLVRTPVPGMLYLDVYGPVDAEGSLGTKKGTACAESILGLIGTGDASIEAAATNGGIHTVTSVDHHSRNMLGIYAEFCTIVRGS